MKIEELEKNSNVSSLERDILDLLVYVLDKIKEIALPSWEKVFTVQTVDQFLFGYNDSLLALINKYDSSLVPSPVFAFQVSIFLFCMPVSNYQAAVIFISFWHLES